MVKWISKKERSGKVKHIPIQREKSRRRKTMTREQMLTHQLRNLRWGEDTDYAFSDAGVDKAKTYNTYYKGYYLKVFPMKLVNKDLEGWEYEIINDDRGIEYSSGAETVGPPAKTPQIAKRWAISTLETFLEEE
jgi:hypothetical protein